MSIDQSQRFIFDKSDVRGELVRLEGSYQRVLDGHSYQPKLASLLGEFIAASVLLSSTLKFDGLLSLQLRCDGPVSLLMAECDSRQQVRAIARGELPLQEQTFEQLFAGGSMAITIEPSSGQRYQGIVPLVGGSLSICLEGYFSQSEQLPTRLWLAAEEGRCAGLLLQRLPQKEAQSVEQSEQMWSHLTHLANTIKAEEMLALPAEQLLHRLYHQEAVRLFEAKAVQFNCNCSRERTERALITLDAQELEEILAEQGEIAMDCQFCCTAYRFSKTEIRTLLTGSSPARPH